MSNVIEVTDLTKRFETHTALDKVSFSVPKGSIYGFLGPNGAGKTTTIKIILGLINRSGGEAKVFSENVSMNKKPDFKRKIGYLPQDPVFPGGLNGREVMEFISETYGLDREAKKRIDNLLERFDLKDAAKRRVAGYSRGMKQRLGLAAVFLPEPELIILDEPVSALDPEGRFEVLTAISDLKGKATVFLSSHILADVERVCDRVVMINKGRKLTEAVLDELMEKYSTEKYTLRVVENKKKEAYDLLVNEPYIREITTDEEAISMTAVHGKLDDLRNSVLKLMIDNQITVIDFTLVKRDLEKIFLDIVSNGSKGVR